MIEAADKYEEQLKNITAHEYPWYHYTLPIDLTAQRMVSTYRGQVIGSIGVVINAATAAVVELSGMSFTETHRVTFGKDVMMFTRYLMQKYRKLSSFVIVGNPAEVTYDRLAKHLGWKIAGVMEKQVLNHEGKWNDVKLYEYINQKWGKQHDPH
jgi:hypothetical protein